MNPENPVPSAPESAATLPGKVPQPQPSSVQQTPMSQPDYVGSPEQKIPAYRSYWIFGAIYLILPPIIGLIILLTGNIYRKQKDGTVKPIRVREKVTLTILAALLWGYLLFTIFGSFPANSNTMAGWFNSNRVAYNQAATDLVSDFGALQQDTPGGSLANKDKALADCQKIKSDVRTGKSLPVMPDTIAQGYYQNELNGFGSLASGCITAIQANATKLPDSALTSVQTASDNEQNLTARLKIDGIHFQSQ